MRQNPQGEYDTNSVQLVISREDLRSIIKEEVGDVLAEQLARIEEKRLAAADEIVEAHVLAEELDKHVDTLARWSKAGQITRVPDTPGREVYYYRSQFTRDKATLAAKKKMLNLKKDNHD